MLGSESSTSFSLSGAKVPGDESSRERKFHGAKVPGSESSTYGTFAPGSESTWERKFHNTYIHAYLFFIALHFFATKACVVSCVHGLNTANYVG